MVGTGAARTRRAQGRRAGTTGAPLMQVCLQRARCVDFNIPIRQTVSLAGGHDVVGGGGLKGWRCTVYWGARLLRATVSARCTRSVSELLGSLGWSPALARVGFHLGSLADFPASATVPLLGVSLPVGVGSGWVLLGLGSRLQSRSAKITLRDPSPPWRIKGTSSQAPP